MDTLALVLGTHTLYDYIRLNLLVYHLTSHYLVAHSCRGQMVALA